MQRLKFIATGLCASIILALVLYACRKHEQGGNGITVGGGRSDIHPVSYPTFTDNNDINSQIRAMAYAMAAAVDDQYMVSGAWNYVANIESLIPNNLEEISFESINSGISMNGSNIYEIPPGTPPSSFNQFVSIVLQYETPNYLYYTPHSSTTPYNSLAYGGFTFNNQGYYTILRIPDFADVKTDANRFHQPLLVVPNETDTFGDPILPIVGYVLDTTTNTMDTVYYPTLDAFEDDSLFYIWVVDIETIPNFTNPPNNCTGADAPVQNDDFCDRDCAEDSIMSPNDCLGQYLRKIWIEEVEISEDYKQRCGTNYEWLESRFNGQYEIAYECLVVHSKKVKPFGGLLNERWYRRQVYKTRKLNLFCNFKSQGSADNKGNLTNERWWTNNDAVDRIAKDDNKGTQPKCYFSQNYKPWRDTIYFIMYEFDNASRRKKRHSFDVYYRAGKKYSLTYTARDNEGPFADKKCNDAPESYNAIGASGKVFMITPSMWPGGGAPSVVSDVYTFNAIMSSGGAIANTRSIKVKVKYDMF